LSLGCQPNSRRGHLEQILEYDIHIFLRPYSSILRHSLYLRVEAFICGANIQPDHFGFPRLVTKGEKDTSLCLCHHALAPASHFET